MKFFRSQKVLRIGILAMLLMIGLPAGAMSQGRSRRANLDKKCSKFVNCHDARDGRWDGRGPQRRVSVIDRIRMRNRRNRRSDDNDRRSRRDRIVRIDRRGHGRRY